MIRALAITKFKLHSGYDVAIGFTTNGGCTGSTDGIFPVFVIRPGTDAETRLPATQAKVVMCKFTIVFDSPVALPSIRP